MKNTLMRFNEKEVEVIELNEQILFNAKNVAEILDIKNVRENLRKMSNKQVIKVKNSDVRKTDSGKSTGIRTFNNAGENFLTEAGLYKLAFRSNKAEAEMFTDWVAEEVLPTIRKSGLYVSENATEEAIDFQKKYGIRRIRKTFNESENVEKDWKQFVELSAAEHKSKRVDNQDRVKLASIVEDTIQKKYDVDKFDMKASEMLAINELLVEIKDQKQKWSNKGYGGQLSHKTKRIKRLEHVNEVLTESKAILERQEEGWCKQVNLNYHAFSVNCMYKSVEDNKVVKTDAYRNWINQFPTQYMPSKADLEEQGIDFNKRIDIRVGFVALAKFDKQNFIKALIDQLFSRVWGVDDKVVKNVDVRDFGDCDSFTEGVIAFQIRNSR